MPTYDEETAQYLNSEFERRLSEVDNSVANVLIEIKPQNFENAVVTFQGMDNVEINARQAVLGKYIPATVPVGAVGQVARLDVVTKVHQDQAVGTLNVNSALNTVRDISLQSDPIRANISESLADFFSPLDDVQSGAPIIDPDGFRFNFFQGPLGDPLRVGLSAVDRLTGANASGVNHVPTSDSVTWVRNSGALSADGDGDTKAAIVDTGYTPVTPADFSRLDESSSSVPGEPVIDGNSHGTWCTNAMTGNQRNSIWGAVDGVATGVETAHFKALNSFPGVGKTSWILSAMEEAVQWGADVVNMSLGGPLQGSVEEDPFCDAVSLLSKENAGDDDGAIFVVAAGNSGPDGYTIGSPGAAPKALTVGSWSITDDEPAVFSSRGPQGKWYGDNPNTFSNDREEYGDDEFIKPDVAVPGGGRANSDLAATEDEMLHQICAGWMEGMNDGYKDGRGSMKGTSMASPQAAGLVTLLYDAGIIETAAEVKQVVAEQDAPPALELVPDGSADTVGGKNTAYGFGRLRESLFDV